MNNMIIKKTRNSPEVSLDPFENILMISGPCYVENALEFFQPIYFWIDEYLKILNTSCSVELTLSYLNTSSTRCLMKFIEKLDNAFIAGKDVTINWYYESDNEILMECGEEFKEDLKLPFNIIPIESE